jgi:hypothetical protein
MIRDDIKPAIAPCIDAAMLAMLEEKGLIRRRVDPATGRLQWIATANFTLLDDGSVIKV